MGVGENQINEDVIAHATAGLSEYLIEKFGIEKSCSNGVVIAHDTRNNSEVFAEITAKVLTSYGIKAFLQEGARPTPQLSFSVKHFGAIAGVVITASHNPKSYNGYKVYDEYGCQLVPAKANEVSKAIRRVHEFKACDIRYDERLIERIDTTEAFVRAVLKQSLYKDMAVKQNLKIVYTPLHGSGNIPVVETLKSAGFMEVIVVSDQEKPDGNFPTVVSPNPEDKEALTLGIKLAKEKEADIVIGTDPDCDRVGMAVRNSAGEYELITGNQAGALLTDYVLNKKQFPKGEKPALVKTVVTSELGALIAQKHGLTVFSTLTGFKYIGEKITQFEKAKEESDDIRDYDFVIGYEESYGYLVGTHARDKDAVVASMLFCEMAAEYKAKGKSLIERLNELYCEYVYYLEALDSYTVNDSNTDIDAIMESFRNSKDIISNAERVIDYSIPQNAEHGFGKLPAENLLKLVIKDGSWVAIRPSGTEPKIKIYYSITGEDKEDASEKLSVLRQTIKNRLGICEE
jgi:phosphoglucomutase